MALLNSGPIVIAGGSGFLGTSLATWLTAAGHHVIVLSRRSLPATVAWESVVWDGRTSGPWIRALDGAQALVNLTGRSVDCIKSPDHCDEILRSRVESTRILGIASKSVVNPPPVWVQMSTAHIYGDPPEVTCDENSPPGYGLAPIVGLRWEGEFETQRLPGQRGVILRTSFVIGRDRGAGGGALKTLARLTRWGLGGTIGSGRQGMSWIHETDLNRIFERAIFDITMSGAWNASSPNPVSQQEFMKLLRHVLRIPVGLPAASWMVRLGAKWLLRTDPELALYGRRVVPQRLLAEGFRFQFPWLQAALADLL